MRRCPTPLLFFLVTAVSAGARIRIPATLVRQVYLSNGLQLVMAKDNRAPVAGVQVWYHIGSRDERPGMRGFAHLFEHLMFDGATNVEPGEFSNYIVRGGGIDNAYTTTDATVFWESIPSNNLPVALWLEADRMRNLRITQDAFDREKEVV